MTPSLRTGQGKVQSTFGTSAEYLFHEPLRRRSLLTLGNGASGPPSGTLRGLEGNPDRTKCHHRIACELRTQRRDSKTSAKCINPFPYRLGGKRYRILEQQTLRVV